MQNCRGQLLAYVSQVYFLHVHNYVHNRIEVGGGNRSVVNVPVSLISFCNLLVVFERWTVIMLSLPL